MLHKINKSDMEGMMEANEEYLRLCHNVAKTPLTYIIRKTTIVLTNSFMIQNMQLLTIK